MLTKTQLNDFQNLISDYNVQPLKNLARSLKDCKNDQDVKTCILWDWDKIAVYPEVAHYIKENIYDDNTMYVRD